MDELFSMLTLMWVGRWVGGWVHGLHTCGRGTG